MSAIEQPVKVPIDDLDTDHRSTFNLVLSSILGTELAERTFAQIIDGIPTRDDVGWFPTYSDEMADNTASSTEAIEAARGLREQLSTYTSMIDAKLAQAYQNASPGTREFHMRLLEVLAVVCHQIAGSVYSKIEPGLRRAGQREEERLAALNGRLTDLRHQDYYYPQQYPSGVADVVGYWAEYHLFGGVVLFDRGESGSDCKNAFLHPVGKFRIFQLSETQIQEFGKYAQHLTEGTQITELPFPFKTERYTYRVDPFDAMSLNIYRDKYERIISLERPRRCVMRADDFPEMQDKIEEMNSRRA